jgi:hypothetical protein
VASLKNLNWDEANSFASCRAFFFKAVAPIKANAQEHVMEFAAMQFGPLCVGLQGNRLVTHSQARKQMANVSKLILGAAVAAVSIGSPALAQYASQSDPSISVHHSKHLRISSHQSGSRAFASVPPVYDPGGRQYPAVDRQVPLFDGSFGGQ